MEPGDHAQLCSKLGQQDALLESQQQQLLAVMQRIQTISRQMATLSTAVQSACPTSADGTATPAVVASSGGARGLPQDPEVREPRLPAPERYNGAPGECRRGLPTGRASAPLTSSCPRAPAGLRLLVHRPGDGTRADAASLGEGVSV